MVLDRSVAAVIEAVVAAALIVWSVGLYARGRSDRQRSVTLWSAGLFVMGAASLVASAAHTGAGSFDPAFTQSIWKLAADLTGLASFFMLAGTIVATVRRPLSYALIGLAIPKYILYVVWIATHRLAVDDYRAVLFDYQSALVIIMGLAVYAAIRLKVRWAAWLIVSMATGFAAGFIQRSDVTLGRFDHNDLYHLVTLISLWLAYRGVRVMNDRDGPTTR